MTNKTNVCERCGVWVPDDAPGCVECGLSWTEGVTMVRHVESVDEILEALGL